MRVRVSDPALLGELRAHLLKVDCDVVQAGSRILSVALREPLPYELARSALDQELGAWLRGRSPESAVLLD